MANLTTIELESKIAELEAKLEKHRICPVYNILTRTGLEEIWEKYKSIEDLAIAFIDIDDLKKANTELGQHEANGRISKAFSLVRTYELINTWHFEIGRFYYGDEAIIIAPASDIIKPCERLLSCLKSHCMSATITICKYTGEAELTDAVVDANVMNQICKKQGKGRIYNLLQ
jgi:GGDEF domain-containing protein